MGTTLGVTRSDLIGTWWLSGYDVVDEGGIHVSSPLGSDPVGQLMYGADAAISVHVMARRRPSVRGTRPVDCSPDERAMFALTHFGYAGRFEVAGNEVVHHVSVASFPSWTGQALRRKIVLAGDQLELTGSVPNAGGLRRSVVLRWIKGANGQEDGSVRADDEENQ